MYAETVAKISGHGSIAANGQPFNIQATTQVEQPHRLVAFKLEAGTGSTFPTCETIEVERLSIGEWHSDLKCDTSTSTDAALPHRHLSPHYI